MVCAVEVYKFSSAAAITEARLGVMNNSASTHKVIVYPNPLSKKFFIHFDSNYQGNISLQLVDMSGRIFDIKRTSFKTVGSTIEVDISKLYLKAGVYFLKINSNEQKTEVIKLLVQ
jgi:hypothetical protein